MTDILLDHAASIRLALSVIEGDPTELEAHHDEVVRALLRAVEGIEAVAAGARGAA